MDDNLPIDPIQLGREDPGFLVYATRVMDTLTGYTSQEWIFVL